jgi:hypothetical protein
MTIDISRADYYQAISILVFESGTFYKNEKVSRGDLFG